MPPSLLASPSFTYPFLPKSLILPFSVRSLFPVSLILLCPLKRPLLSPLDSLSPGFPPQALRQKWFYLLARFLPPPYETLCDFRAHAPFKDFSKLLKHSRPTACPVSNKSTIALTGCSFLEFSSPFDPPPPKHSRTFPVS